MRRLEHQVFLLLLFGASLAFGWILQPFYGAILWAVVTALIFAPLNRKLLGRTGGRPTLAALATLLVIVAMVILPLVVIAASLAQEASGLYAKMQSGEFNIAGFVQRVVDALPAWATGLLDRFKLTSLSAVRERLASGLMEGGQILAPQALSIGINTFDFMVGLGIMLYLLFFLLRDGEALVERSKVIIPLRADQKTALFSRFADVVRATVKGGILVAVAQGALGGLAFWFLGIHAALLWAVLMAFLSLLPAIGAGLVWMPVAIYLLATGAVWQGDRSDLVRGARHRTGGQCPASIPDRQGYQAAGLCRADFHAGRHQGVWSEWLCHWTLDRSHFHGELGNLLRIQVSLAESRPASSDTRERPK